MFRAALSNRSDGLPKGKDRQVSRENLLDRLHARFVHAIPVAVEGLLDLHGGDGTETYGDGTETYGGGKVAYGETGDGTHMKVASRRNLRRRAR